MGEIVANALGTSFAGLKIKVWLVIAAVVAGLAFVAVKIADNAFEDTLDTAAGKGRAEAVIEGHETTLEQTGAANEAGNKVRDDRGSARFDECLRNVAESHRAFCDRYRAD